MPLILVVEDDVDIANLVAMVLSELPCTVVLARDGERALELATEQPADLVLLDARLPGMTGEEVAEKLRELSPPPPIVVFSASADLAAIAQRIGAVGFIRKPFDLDELAGTVERALAASAPTARSMD